MRPSLITLFKRGRYFRPAALDDEEQGIEAQKERREAERFAMSAIAFCIQQDPKSFGVHFFDQICRMRSSTGVFIDPALNLHGLSVTVEENNLDLVIRNTTPSGAFVYVIEGKIGAGLSENQDPSKSEFWEDGYQSKLEDLVDAKTVRYIILGHRDRISPIKAFPSKFSFFQRRWTDLQCGLKRTGLSLQIRELLAELRVNAFMLEKTEEFIAPNMKHATFGYMVLHDVCRLFDFTKMFRKIDVDATPEGWHFGLEVGPVRDGERGSANLRKLTTLVNPHPRNGVCWFGYGGGTFKGASVWFYVSSPANLQNVKRMLRKSKLEGKIEEEAGSLIIMKDMKSKTPDRDWFTRVFETVGLVTR